MTILTTKQIEQAQDLIEKYGFCTLETQKELAEAGFFEKVKCNLSLCVDSNNETIEIWGNAKESIVLSRFTLIPMPQMGEVWRALKPEIINCGVSLYKSLNVHDVYYEASLEDIEEMQSESITFIGESIENDNETEAMCQLWLKLHKENLL